ncbi:YktB family protein [Neobacillus sp. LXY-1]|uniref:YktB family protein n=1 Tax=Neobacillus sp. LXY-1 TaxID=3379133 RepID=UPI003EE1A694
MEVTRFTNEDFDVFTIDGLDPRMEALKMKIRPKLESLGQYFAPTLTTLTGDEMFVHVAKHARRTVHPPKDTWVAFANNPRGYKMLPHFQIGLWETHLFIWFAVIYEAPHKAEIGKRLSEKLAKIHKDIPKNFVWSMDHTKPETIQNETLSKEELQAMFDRLQTVKKAELLCGYVIDRNDAIQLNSEQLISKIQKVFESLTPLFNLAVKK